LPQAKVRLLRKCFEYAKEIRFPIASAKTSCVIAGKTDQRARTVSKAGSLL
jgi:hypothetical protein